MTTLAAINAPPIRHSRPSIQALRQDAGAAGALEPCATREEEVEAGGARGVTPIVLEVRKLLAETRGAIDLPEVARRLGLSSRSLQRHLHHAGVSFRTELAEARFRAAEQLLRGEDKIAVVAAQLGLSQTGLSQLTHARAGTSPGELRRRLQASDRPRRAS